MRDAQSNEQQDHEDAEVLINASASRVFIEHAPRTGVPFVVGAASRLHRLLKEASDCVATRW